MRVLKDDLSKKQNHKPPFKNELIEDKPVVRRQEFDCGFQHPSSGARRRTAKLEPA